MLKQFKNTTLSVCLATVLASTSITALNASAIEATTESLSAYLEAPNFEGQINRINTGINFIRLNTDVLKNMQISKDATWADAIGADDSSVIPISEGTRETIKNIVKEYEEKGSNKNKKDFRYVVAKHYDNEIKINPDNKDATLETKKLVDLQTDAYYSTVGLTNGILGRPNMVIISPLTTRLYLQANIIYKNLLNNNPEYKIPDMNVFPDISSIKTFTEFKEKTYSLIKVEASSGNQFNSVEEAALSLLPEKNLEEVNSAKEEKESAQEELDNASSVAGSIEAWLDDDKNSGSPETASKEEELKIAEATQDEKEKIFETKEEIYFLSIENGVKAIASDFDKDKVALAKKVDGLLSTVDSNALNAVSMFISAGLGLMNGLGELPNELKAISAAQNRATFASMFVDKKAVKQALSVRNTRLIVGAIMAIPNMAVGLYKAGSQASEAGAYQDITEAILAIPSEEVSDTKK